MPRELDEQPDGAADGAASQDYDEQARRARKAKRAQQLEEAEETFHPGAVPPQYIGALTVPFPYEVWGDGVWSRGPKSLPPATIPTLHDRLPPDLWRGRLRVTTRPIWPLARGLGVEGIAELLQIGYAGTDGAFKAQWLTRAEATNANEMVKLGAIGIPADSLNVKALMLYLKNMEAENLGNMLSLPLGERTGPYALSTPGGPPRMGWLLGDRWLGEGRLAANPRGAQRYLTAFVEKGDRDAWYARWRELRDDAHPFAWVRRFLIGASFAAPLLRFVNGRTFIVHHWGDSGNAKTAISVFALSVWGDWNKLFSHLNRTAVSLTEVFKYVTDQMIVYDEKQAQTVENHELIYQTCLNTGRERAEREGGLRDRATWLSIIRTTGEVPLIGPKDVGGQFNRVLQLHSPAHYDKDKAAELYSFANMHHGFAGPEFLYRLYALVNDPASQGWLFAEHKRLTAELRERSGAEANHNGYAAVIALGQALAESWLLGIDYEQAWRTALEDATRALMETNPGAQKSYAERALSILRDHALANPALYRDERTAEQSTGRFQPLRLAGFLATWGALLIPTQADQTLRYAGFETSRVWRDFAELGWLQWDRDGYQLTAQLAGGSYNVYCIRPEVFYGVEAVDAQRTARKLRVVQGGLSMPGAEQPASPDDGQGWEAGLPDAAAE